MNPTEAILVIAILGIIALVVVFLYRRAGAQRTRDQFYAELKALPAVSKNFTTPEGAILCLEDAYRRHDLEAAIAAKDFKMEARLILLGTGLKDFIDDEMVAKTADALLSSFRAHTTAKWPTMEGSESYFVKREPHSDKVVVVTEICRFPDGGLSRQQILVSETAQGWRVLNPVSAGP